MKTYDEILLTYLFQSSVNAAIDVHGLFPTEWVLVLMDEEDEGKHIFWDRSLHSAFIWGDSLHGQIYYQRIDEHRHAQIP